MRYSSSEARNERGTEKGRRLHRELRVVEECDARVRRTVLGLSRLPAHRAPEEEAREAMRDLSPCLEDALEALRSIEVREGGLADRELARRRAFRALLEAALEPEGGSDRPG